MRLAGGVHLVPLNLYFKEGRVKVTLGLARGRKAHDKRAAIAARTENREALELLRAHGQRLLYAERCGVQQGD